MIEPMNDDDEQSVQDTASARGALALVVLLIPFILAGFWLGVAGFIYGACIK